ncbi:S1/P1 nuclease [Dillenia turbinata]|uniref:Aspergillus nuclease S1 n=1 Tax=Dillenia turbinata TaxID=194707 RepID=A0AAN8V5C3_9MAGN
MECCRYQLIPALISLIFLCPLAHGWGVDGHLIICKIAQSRLSKSAEEAVEQLLPGYADNDLSSLCSWADRVRFRYRWSAPLHFINTPDVCNYQYDRDCKDENGEKDRCAAGAIHNYTTQLLNYGKSSQSDYNLTEGLLFLSHFMGDIHQPLHVGFASDRGGNDINVRWYTRKQVLHHVWDNNIIETAEQRFYNEDVQELIDAIQHNITTEWADQVKTWEACSETACPDIYASEGIKAACDYAYKGVEEGSVLKGKVAHTVNKVYFYSVCLREFLKLNLTADDYFLSRLPIVNLRLAQGGVRLAATLNRIFG